MSVIQALCQRNSQPRLIDPGPTEAEIAQMVQCAVRAPDHGHLRPWQFVAITGERRNALGDVFVRSLQLRQPDAPEAEIQRARTAPLRAPVMLAGLLAVKEHPKISRTEQIGAVACALHSVLLAAEALGYSAIWRTGPYATDPLVIRELGGAPQDEVVGFIYLGSAGAPAKPLPNESVADYLRYF